MKTDHQGNCEYQFSSIFSIFIAIINFSCFVLISVKDAMDNRLALFAIKRNKFKENF